MKAKNQGKSPSKKPEAQAARPAKAQGKGRDGGGLQASYINLCQDAMFKAFFSKDKRLLRSLADTFVRFPEGKTLESLKIKDKDGKDWMQSAMLALKDPAKHPKFPGGKAIVLDLLAALDTGESVNIEMQTLPHAHFKERTLYYWSDNYGEDFRAGAGYEALRPSYSLIFTLFSLFSQSKALIHSFSIRSDKPPHFMLTNHLRMKFVDLSYFSLEAGGRLEMIVDMASAWRYFIRNSAFLTDRDWAALFRINKEIFEVAKAVLREISAEGDVRRLERLRGRWLSDYVSDISSAEKKSRQEGRQEGREEGRQEGRQEERRAVILNMLQEKFDISAISRVTGLPEAEIIKLKNGEIKSPAAAGIQNGRAD